MTESELDRMLTLLNITLPRLSEDVRKAIDEELENYFVDDPEYIDEWGVFGEDFLREGHDG